jgi:hypothetical protein
MQQDWSALWLAAQTGATGEELERASSKSAVDLAGALRIAAANDHVDTLREILQMRVFTSQERAEALAAAAHGGNRAAFDLLAAGLSADDLNRAVMEATDYADDDAIEMFYCAFPSFMEEYHELACLYPLVDRAVWRICAVVPAPVRVICIDGATASQPVSQGHAWVYNFLMR